MVFALFSTEEFKLFFGSYTTWAQARYQTDRSLNITSITF